MQNSIRRDIALVAAALVISLSIAGAAEPPVPVAGVVAPNVVVISPTLVTAGQPTRASLQGLKAEGYNAVIYPAPGDSKDAIPDQAEILKSQDIDCVHVPIPWQTPEAKHLAATAEALNRLKGQKVLVHCQMNMRVSAVTFLYRTIYAKEDPATAWVDVKKMWTPKDQWATFIDQQLRANGIQFKPE